MNPASDAAKVMCPYCHSTSKQFCVAQDLRKGVVKGDFTYFKCTACGSVFQDPMPDRSLIPSFYEGDYNPYETYVQQFVWGLGDLPLQGDVLDVGCGAGNTLASFHEKYPSWKIHGYDFSSIALEKAAARMPEGIFKPGDLYELLQATPTGSFDIVLCEHVIEHVLNPKQLFSELIRILKPGGRLLLAYPNGGSLTQGVFKKYYFNLEAPRHIALPTPDSFVFLTKEQPAELIQLRGQTYPTTFLGSLELATGVKGISRILQKVRLASVVSWALMPFKEMRWAMPFFSKVNAIYKKI
jgi:SAM-dependent methyltransferase